MVNKLFIMVPVMLASRKLDAEDPTQVFWLRVAYGTIQTISVLIVVYTYIQATAIAGKSGGATIYVPPAAQVRAPQCFGGENGDDESYCLVLQLIDTVVDLSRTFLLFVTCVVGSSLSPTPMRKRSTLKSSLGLMSCPLPGPCLEALSLAFA